MKDRVVREYKHRYGSPQLYIQSPGRANIIGEHTDYNHGLVLPFAIEQGVGMAIGKNDIGMLRIVALDIKEESEVPLSHITFQTTGWIRYFINSLVALDYAFKEGIDIVFGGNLPQGGGVSSSSALTCGFLAGVNALFDYNHTIDNLISLASQAENGIGLNGGIMDQTAILKGREGKALMIDFLDFSISEYDMPDDQYSFYLCNSGQKHNLVDTEYNKRRATCESALSVISKYDPSVKTMRDITHAHLHTESLSQIAKMRCRHVVEENQRVMQATSYLVNGEIGNLGQLLLASHNSLSQLYEVSTPEIDYLVSRAQKIENMLGSRIMGGGFGGCTINLVRGSLSGNDISDLAADYLTKTGLHLDIYQIKANDGVQVEIL